MEGIQRELLLRMLAAGAGGGGGQGPRKPLEPVSGVQRVELRVPDVADLLRKWKSTPGDAEIDGPEVDAFGLHWKLRLVKRCMGASIGLFLYRCRSNWNPDVMGFNYGMFSGEAARRPLLSIREFRHTPNVDTDEWGGSHDSSVMLADAAPDGSWTAAAVVQHVLSGPNSAAAKSSAGSSSSSPKARAGGPEPAAPCAGGASCVLARALASTAGDSAAHDVALVYGAAAKPAGGTDIAAGAVGANRLALALCSPALAARAFAAAGAPAGKPALGLPYTLVLGQCSEGAAHALVAHCYRLGDEAVRALLATPADAFHLWRLAREFSIGALAPLAAAAYAAQLNLEPGGSAVDARTETRARLKLAQEVARAARQFMHAHPSASTASDAGARAAAGPGKPAFRVGDHVEVYEEDVQPEDSIPDMGVVRDLMPSGKIRVRVVDNGNSTKYALVEAKCLRPLHWAWDRAVRVAPAAVSATEATKKAPPHSAEAASAACVPELAAAAALLNDASRAFCGQHLDLFEF